MTTPSDVATDRLRSRRADPRVEVLSRLHGTFVALDVPIEVLDLSAGGFAIVCEVPFPAGVAHQFRFRTMSGLTIVMPGISRHCMRVTPPSGTHRYVIGFEFALDAHHETGRKIDALLDAATSAISFH